MTTYAIVMRFDMNRFSKNYSDLAFTPIKVLSILLAA